MLFRHQKYLLGYDVFLNLYNFSPLVIIQCLERQIQSLMLVINLIFNYLLTDSGNLMFLIILSLFLQFLF
jgi:hypothetical protein